MRKVTQLYLYCALFLSPPLLADDYRVCDKGLLHDAALPTAFNEDYNVWLAKYFPHHSANDSLVLEGGEASIEGKFSYGPLGKDLEEEQVEVWIDNCGEEVKKIGEAKTDQDGRIAFSFSQSIQYSTGQYRIYQRVKGDGTTVKSWLHVLPEKTELVVIDIDGTLTVGDSELWVYISDNSYVPKAREKADEMTQLLSDWGYHLVYLTGRHYAFSEHSRDWLKKFNFADGTLITTNSMWQSWPAIDGVGNFKTDELAKLKNKGFKFRYGYGNSKTDIYAYEKAGIPKSHTFILGDEGGFEDTVRLGEDFEKHMTYLTSVENNDAA